ncbi:RidA family protein [Halomonas llamarensis]|uniref:RidA family protein n=1 Tax=Halomonas llamarensis TaxID=2945104 RepID=A0ABT0SVC8_9GAMM|nr:RidA family protein [Halomonas llamarensis]MCL7931596.1 RidA family protein [Halomonas llamarensis]
MNDHCSSYGCSTRGNFRSYVMSKNMLYLSGKGAPLREPGGAVPKVGQEVTVEQARDFAQEVGLYLLALTQEALGDFERVQRVVKVFGMVNADPNFTSHTEVVNGCSDLFVTVLGERGSMRVRPLALVHYLKGSL